MFYVVEFNGHICSQNKEISFIKIVKAFGRIIDFPFFFPYTYYGIWFEEIDGMLWFHFNLYFPKSLLTFKISIYNNGVICTKLKFVPIS